MEGPFVARYAFDHCWKQVMGTVKTSCQYYIRIGLSYYKNRSVSIEKAST